MQAIAQAAVEAAKAVVLAINGEGRKQSINAQENGAKEATIHRTGPSLRQAVFN